MMIVVRLLHVRILNYCHTFFSQGNDWVTVVRNNVRWMLSEKDIYELILKSRVQEESMFFINVF